MNATLLKKRANVKPDSPLSDEELLVRYSQSGEREHFAVLVHRYERELFNYLHRYLGDAQAAEDAFQAAFLQVHLKCSQFEEGRKFRPWLYAIATNQAIDARRRDKHRRMISLDRPMATDDGGSAQLLDLLVSDAPLPSQHLSEEERLTWLTQALQELPEYLRQPLTLIYFQDLSYREAAEALGVPLGTVKSRSHSAIEKLHAAWMRKFAETP
jgi:RNA polymerase sigma-70 factor (ECF subfamily)